MRPDSLIRLNTRSLTPLISPHLFTVNIVALSKMPSGIFIINFM